MPIDVSISDHDSLYAVIFTTYTCACVKGCAESIHLPQRSVKH